MAKAKLDIIIGPMFSGKCFGEKTPILMFDGTIKNVENIKINDEIMGDDSTKRKVLSVVHSEGQLYKVHQEHGIEYIVNEDHILSLFDVNDKNIKNMSVMDFLQYKSSTSLKGYTTGIEFRPKEINNSPYEIGLNIDRCEKIPEEIMINSSFIRKQFVLGLFDKFKVINNLCFVENISEFLKREIYLLCRTLGLVVYIKENAVIINEKIENLTSIKTTKRKVYDTIEIKKDNIGDYYGFTLSGNGLFLLGDCTVSHNTTEVLHRLMVLRNVYPNVAYINHKIDTRSDLFSTHNPLYDTKVNKIDMIKTDDLNKIDVEKYDVIGVDEAQFFCNLSVIIDWVNHQRKHVIIAGLDGDSEREKFGKILDLIPQCDTIQKLTSFCVACASQKKKTDAIFTYKHKLEDKNNQICVGGEDVYIPLCRECYNQKTNIFLRSICIEEKSNCDIYT